MMAGAELGGPPGRVLSGLLAQGVNVTIAAGLEKYAPVDIREAMAAAGRARIERSRGMAVGLMPLQGRLITEVEAISLMYSVSETQGRQVIRHPSQSVPL
ncbi:MAG: hypothetical protein AB1331_00300 [Bacillota bacterium]